MISGQLKLLNPVTAAYTDIGTAQPSYNAMGYNVADNYLYAMSTGAGTMGDLLRIADDGSVTNLGLPSGLPAGSYIAGDFDNAGNLILRNSATQWYSVDVATNVATSLTITGANTGNDLLWINGVAYLLDGTTLYRVDLSTDIATSVPVSGIVSGTFGAAWSDNPNEMFFSDNTTGHIYEITGFTGASPVGTLKLTGTVTSDNDGAACKNADSPFDLPVANNDTYAVTSDITLNENAAGGVLSNDVGTGLTAILGTGPTHGALTLNANGSFTYTPTAGFFGTDTFTYSVQDQFGRDSATDATVTLNVSRPAAPVAVSDAYTTTANTTINQNAGGGLLANDAGTGITVTGNTPPTHGAVMVNALGSFVYTPTSGYSGADSFSYTITDAFNRTSTATASFTINPAAADVTGSGTGPAAFTVTPTAPIGVGPFTYALTTMPPGADGTASINPVTGVITFTPAAGFSGTVPTFDYTVTDASSDVSAPATIDLTVGEPAAPVAVNDTYTTTANTAINQAAGGGLLSNDTGASPAVTGHTAPTHGTVTVNADGSFLYTPTAGYSGPDSFGYTDTDAYGRMSSATAFFTVDPVAFNVTGSGTGPAPIVVTPPAPTGTGPFAYSLTSLPPGSDGIASMDPSTGQITFTPTAVFSGVVTTFTYTVIDAADDVSAPADIVLTVDLPALPVAVDDTYTTIANTAINQVASGGLLSNDTGASPAVTGHTAPTHGTVTVNADGSFLYTPTAGYSGPDSFGYTDTDAYGRMSSATAFFTVDPVAFNVTGSGTGPAPIVVTPPAPIGTGPFTYTLVTAPPVGNGIAMMDATSGVITFTPAVGFSGVVTTFTYTITDAADDVSAPANIVLTVDLPALPVAVDDTYATTANTAINQIASGGLLSNDTGTSPTVTGHTPPTHGTVTVNADGSFLYTPTAGYSGPDSFGYTDTDAYGRMSSATASITVDPVAMNVTGSGPGPGVIQATPPAPTGTGPFTYTLVTTPPGSDGTATMDPTTGVITFTPNAGFHGTVPTFTYTVTDASDDVSVPADIDLSVGLPTPPVAQNVSGTTPANVSITRTPAAPTGTGPFTFALATTPSASDGVAIIDPTTGAVTFTPAHDFSGIVPSFTYTATDADDQVSEPADVSIDVTPLDAPASGSGPPEKPITVQPPAPVGTGPFTYTLVPGSLPPAADGTVSIDPTTGAITFTPAPGFTGTTTVEYTVTDSDGLTSPAAVVTFDVSGASATVPSTGAMEGPMLAGILLVVLGLLMIVGALVRRTRKFAPNFTPRA